MNLRQFLRIILTIILLGIAMILVSIAAVGLPITDFSTYWAAGRLNLTGENPYDASQLLTIIRTVGWVPEGRLSLFNPPSTLAFIMPFGAIPYLPARSIWLMLTLAVFIGCSAWAWEVYGGHPSHRWVAMLLIIIFGPLAHLLKVGQITWLMALGVTSFVFFIRKERYFWAGVAVSLVVIKPQLYYLIPLIIVLWSLQQRQWGILAGMFVSLLAQTILGLLPNPSLIQQFINSMLYSPPSNWQTASIGTLLRFIFGPEKFWLQFVPTILGASGAIAFWLSKRHQWDWVRFTPLLCIASIATSAYNWTHDVPLIFLAIIQAAVLVMNSRSVPYKLILLAIYVAFCLATLLLSLPQHYFWWIGVFLFGLYGLITLPRIVLSPANRSSYGQSTGQEK